MLHIKLYDSCPVTLSWRSFILVGEVMIDSRQLDYVTSWRQWCCIVMFRPLCVGDHIIHGNV